MIAVERNYCEPRIVQESVIYIEDGRHPLCELCTDVFIPNNSIIHENQSGSRIQMISGPNYSGKSIYLKQVALISFMAHIGCWVPAKSCQASL